MNPTNSAQAFRGYTISVRVPQGRLIVHIEEAALVKLGALADDGADQLRTLNRHAISLHALALQRWAREGRTEITIEANDLA